MRSLHIIFLMQLLTVTVKCDDEEETASKKLLPFFRRLVEEDLDNINKRAIDSNDHHDNLVSFLVNNAKEIFSNNDEITEFSVSPLPTRTTELLSTNSSAYISTTEEDPNLTDDVNEYTNASLSTKHFHDTVSAGYDTNKAKSSHMLLLSENSVKKSGQKIFDNQTFGKQAMDSRDIIDLADPKGERSCIFCNNVMSADCTNPKNKLITSVVCERDGDQCYSLHTPFGVVDRGCFSSSRNLSTYVCACNLCNYLTLAEMPHFFLSMREWVHDVVELSRTRSLRKTVHRNMSCLKCEVNSTDSSDDAKEHCLSGSVGTVPTETCNINEICAVKVIKSEGYLWRGCVRSPLYNYWWTVCDHDLCNYDDLVSIYDYV